MSATATGMADIPPAAFDPKQILALDPYLEPYVPALEHRYAAFKAWRDTIHDHEGGYENFTAGYRKLGFNVAGDGTVTYREWAPGADEAVLTGDFSARAHTRPSEPRLTLGRVTYRRLEQDHASADERSVRHLGDRHPSEGARRLRDPSRLQSQGGCTLGC
jgi:hypothetical protein